MKEPMMCDSDKFNALCDVLNISESERENALSLEIRIASDEFVTYKMHKMAAADSPESTGEGLGFDNVRGEV